MKIIATVTATLQDSDTREPVTRITSLDRLNEIASRLESLLEAEFASKGVWMTDVRVSIEPDRSEV